MALKVNTITDRAGTGSPSFPFGVTANDAISTKTTTYTVLTTDRNVLLDATGGAFTVTLPSASGNSGLLLRLQKIDSSANALTISPSLRGATRKLTTQYESVELISDGSNWQVLRHYWDATPKSVTFTAPANTFGTLTAQTMWMERRGNFARFYGRLRAGTVASGADSSLLLPTGFVIDSAFIAGSDDINVGLIIKFPTAGGSFAPLLSGTGTGSQGFLGVINNGSTDRVFVTSSVGSGNHGGRNTNAEWSSSDYMTIDIMVPITDWWA